MALLNMTREMYRKNIEIGRIVKTSALLMMSGISSYDIDVRIVNACLASQRPDGGFIGNSDTIWAIKFLSFFPEHKGKMEDAVQWLIQNNGEEPGFGRSKRDMHRIPVTGLALYLLPVIANQRHLLWLENAWISEANSLTYKAAYTLLAFHVNGYSPTTRETLLVDTLNWLVSQQQASGGFAPWLDHPAGENVYCTAVALLALVNLSGKFHQSQIEKAYHYLCSSQLKSGIWRYHEIEDGASWGLFALTQAEEYFYHFGRVPFHRTIANIF